MNYFEYEFMQESAPVSVSKVQGARAFVAGQKLEDNPEWNDAGWNRRIIKNM